MGEMAIERLEVSQNMIRRVLDHPTYRLASARFFAEEEIGRAEVRGFLSALAVAA